MTNLNYRCQFAIYSFFILLQIIVVDGDTLNINHERIRLIGIDAPEMMGHCRQGRVCVKGNPHRSKASLQSIVNRGGSVKIVRRGYDRYGRTLASVSIGTTNLSCHQIRTHNAVYVPRWDRTKIISNSCNL